jgi:hypothetical protein
MTRLVRFRCISATAVVIGMLLAMVSTALAAPPADQKLVPASGRLAGFTGGQLLGEELRQLFAIPLDRNPLVGKGEDSCFGAGNKDKVLILWTRPPDEPPAECTVKPGTPVFLYGYFFECSNVEEPPSFGATEAEQRACANAGLDLAQATFIKKILVSIDGPPPIDILSNRYRAVSPQMTTNLPEDNIFDTPERNVPAGTMTFVAAGWVAMIRPLPPGRHTIRDEVVPKKGTPFVTDAVVNVVPGHKN